MRGASLAWVIACEGSRRVDEPIGQIAGSG